MDVDNTDSGSSFGPRGQTRGHGHQPPPQDPLEPVHPYRPHKTNGKSIAGMVLGILSLIVPYIGFLIGIFAIIFSSLALKEIKRRGEQGRGMAIAGLVCGIIGTALYAILIALMIVAFFLFGDSINLQDYENFS